jgi:lariat debranching enzyme
MPYDNSSMRSIYHIREYNIRRLSLLSSPPIFLSHDWPQSIQQHGDLQGLLSRKPFFRSDIQTGKLGSPPLMGLLRTLRPNWWFSAHLHVRFQATVVHDGRPPGSSHQIATPVPNPDEIMIDDDDIENGDSGHAGALPPDNAPAAQSSAPSRNSDEIVLSDEEEDVALPPPPPPPPCETKFLALDKCLPRRQFLEIVDVPVPEVSSTLEPNPHRAQRPPRLTYDPEWLAITRAFHPFLSTERQQPKYPDEDAARLMIQKELEWVRSNVKNKSDSVATGIRDVDDCQPFVMTAPGPGQEGDAMRKQPPWYTNPQTEAFCAMLDLDNKINPPPAKAKPVTSHAAAFRKSLESA